MLREVDGAHAAGAEQAQDLELADAFGASRWGHGRFVEEAEFVEQVQQLLDAAAMVGVALA